MPAITVAPVSERSHASFAAEARKEKNSHTPELNDTAYKESTKELYQTLRPMFLTMKVFGVYYLDGASLGKGLLARVSFGYSVAVLIMMLGNLAMDMALVAGFRTLDDIVVRGAFRVLDIYIASHCVVMFLNCLRKNAWREFFMMYHVVQDGDWFVDDHNHRQLKKRVYVYVAICWAAILCNIGFGTYFVFWTNLSQHLIFNVSKDNVQLMIAKCFFTIILVYISAVWIIPIALLVVINDLLATIFKVFNEKLAQRVKDCPMNLCDCIGQLRDKHQDLTNLTLTADTLLAGLAGMAIVFNVMIICCFSYAMIYNPFNFSDPLITVGQVFWLVTSLLIIFMSTITCSCVNGEAHGAYDILQNLKIRRVTEEFSIQMNVFLSKLTGSSIGISAGKMFVIDKNAILTVVGLLATYVILLFQARPSTSPTCGCTSTQNNFTNQTV